MARPRIFDAQTALATVCELFWSEGFAATSMDDITRATGIGRQSLYNTFGSKEQLFEAALKKYRDREFGRLVSALEINGSLRIRLTHFFDVVLEILMRCDGRGCLLANTITELGQVGAGAKTVVEANAKAVKGRLRSVIREAQRRGEIALQPSAEAQGAYLFNNVLGLSAMARLGTDGRRMRQIVRVALDAVA